MANSRLLTSHPRKPSGHGGGLPISSSSGPLSNPSSLTGRLRLRHLVLFLCSISAFLFFFGGGSSSSSSSGAGGSAGKGGVGLAALRKGLSQKELARLMDYCPWSTRTKHVPTVILAGTQSSSPRDNRTYFVVEPSTFPASSSSSSSAGALEGASASFLPYAYPPRDLRLAQTMSSASAAGSAPHAAAKAGQGHLHEGLIPADEPGQHLCRVHAVPSSPRPELPVGWERNSIMFGMSTTPDRVLWNLPVWAHWVPSRSPPPLDPSQHTQTSQLPLVLVLTPPPNPTEQARSREAMEEANGMGMYVELRPREAERFETRYFALAEEMWRESEKRALEGVRTDWFVFSDDDTFFPDFDSLARLVSQYNPADDVLIGTLSESTKQVAQWGHIAYGGAGIIVSRGTLEKMNKDGVWQHCLDKFGAAFGGDAMVTHCAALVMDKTAEQALTVEDTMHQLDIRGDGTGFFQSGFLITSLHHWGSWFTLFPPWHETGAGDLRKGITLVGKAARGVGGDNWGRRYVFEEGKVVVALGYSVTVHAKAVPREELDKSEHTWWEFETFHPIRPGLEEALDKRTYYLTGVRTLGEDGVVRLEHKNREGERVDVVWDQGVRKKGWFGRV
ncbi:hypothetical protein JCM8097_006654 [Rhodosporidiobolus ruineniae]